MKNLKSIVAVGIGVLTIGIFESCRKEVFVLDSEITGVGLADWTTATHSSSAIANYAMVFDQTKVNRIDLVLTSDEYKTMQDDLEDILGSSSGGQGGPGGGGPGGGGNTFSDETPVYVAADFYFNGKQSLSQVVYIFGFFINQYDRSPYDRLFSNEYTVFCIEHLLL